MIKKFFLGENTELTSRLQTVRQKAVELEKNLANVTASCDKYQEVKCMRIFKHCRRLITPPLKWADTLHL